MRIGPRHDKVCAEICTLDGQPICLTHEIRYLGVFIVRSTKFKCSIDHAKRAFYREANGIFGKVERIASEEVVLQLIKLKCIPVLLYRLEVCNLAKRDLQSLDFTVNRFFMKLFQTSNIEVEKECQNFFDFMLLSVLFSTRMQKFVLINNVDLL